MGSFIAPETLHSYGSYGGVLSSHSGTGHAISSRQCIPSTVDSPQCTVVAAPRSILMLMYSRIIFDLSQTVGQLTLQTILKGLSTVGFSGRIHKVCLLLGCRI